MNNKEARITNEILLNIAYQLGYLVDITAKKHNYNLTRDLAQAKTSDMERRINEIEEGY